MVIDRLAVFLNSMVMTGMHANKCMTDDSELYLFWRKGLSSGLDVQLLAQDATPLIEELHSLVREEISAYRLILVRVMAIILVLAVIRMILVVNITDDIWGNWIVLDRTALLLMGLISGSSVALLMGRLRESSWSSCLDDRLKVWFQSYITLSAYPASKLGFSDQMRAIRRAELMAGIDGQPLRLRLYLGYIRAFCIKFRLQRARWPYWVMVIDLGMFVLGGIGGVLVPFAAWLETAALAQ